MSPQAVETLIIPGWMVPVVPRGQVLQGHALALGASKIMDIGPG